MRIFVASSGRCGTGFLSGAFRQCTNISSFHEQDPVLVGDLLNQANKSGIESEELKHKAKKIREQYSFYIDTAHQFMRGFYKYALEEMPKLKVIKLARNPLEVGRSCLNRGDIPGKTKWLGKYNDEDNLIKLEEDVWNKLTDFQKILLDWIEHEYRFEKVKESFDQVVYIRFEELKNFPEVTLESLFIELGIKNYSINNLDKVNKNENKKETVTTEEDLTELLDLIVLLKNKNYNLNWLENEYYKGVLCINEKKSC